MQRLRVVVVWRRAVPVLRATGGLDGFDVPSGQLQPVAGALGRMPRSYDEIPLEELRAHYGSRPRSHRCAP
jgi:hypothetical protein